METLADRHSPTRGWGRLFGTGAAAFLAIGILGSATPAGAAASTHPRIGATGSIAALNASSMEVQNPSSGQTTVSWTPTTSFSKSVTESVSAVSVGDCVTATGSVSKKSKTTIAARSITLTQPNSSGACGATAKAGTFRVGAGSGRLPAGGFQFRGGSDGGPRNFPQGAARKISGGAAGRNFRRQLANLDIASGKVTAVHRSTLTISGVSISPGRFRSNSKSAGKSPKHAKRPPKLKTETLKITSSRSTPVNTSQSATSADLAIGDCVTAFGPAATNGSVTASTVRITSTGGGSCTGGFPGGGAFFGGPGA